MKNALPLIALLFVSTVLLSCAGGKSQPASPIETLKTYTKAVKQKDVETMKLLLSDATMKMNELEAQARGIPVDDVIRNETLFSEHQRTVKWRNETINGDLATLEVENVSGIWETVPFVLENGAWKIDKKGFAQRLMQEADKSSQELDSLIDQSRQPPPQ